MLMALAVTPRPGGFCPTASVLTPPRSTSVLSGILTVLVAFAAIACRARALVPSSPGTLAMAVAIWPIVALEASTSE